MEANALYKLAEQLGQVLSAAEYRLVTAESCTGGGIAKICTEVAGSSAWFDCAWVTYSNQSKQDLLGVSAQTLLEHGAVSEATVVEMVQGALKRAKAQVAIAVSGIAGPTGGTVYKPVGTVCIAWLIFGQEVQAKTFYFQGDRSKIRDSAVAEALRYLLSLLQ